MADILETAMIILFGFSWPNNIVKSIKTKSTAGKSLAFLIIVDLGYICGIASKLISGKFEWYVLFFYILNFTMVTTDMMLYFRYRAKERAEGK